MFCPESLSFKFSRRHSGVTLRAYNNSFNFRNGGCYSASFFARTGSVIFSDSDDGIILPGETEEVSVTDKNQSQNPLEEFQNFIKNSWGNDITGKEKYFKEGEFFVVNDGLDSPNQFRYKKEGNTFTQVPY